ncbi:MAG: sensor histidine kinase [Suilimivivens sp.]
MMVVISLGFLFEALSIVFCIYYLYGEKVRIDMIAVGYIIADVALMDVVYFSDVGQIWTLLIYPVMILYCGIQFGFRFKTIFINLLLNTAILSILQTTIIVICNIVLKIERIGPLENLIINAILLCIIIFGMKKCKLKKIADILQSNEKIVLFSTAIVVASIIIFTLSYKQKEGFDLLYYVVLGISIIMIAIAAIDIGKHKLKAAEAEAELRTHKLYEASFRNLIDDIRARQHEFDNHINAIRSLPLCYKTYDELVAAQGKYCEGIQKENRMNKLLSKGNPAITGFLYTKFLELEKEGIPFSYRIVIGELECKVPVYKMVELLGNLIKNAAEAVKERRAGEVRVVMIEEPDRIQIEVSNESDVIDYKKIQQFFKKGYSEKGENRGYGLYNVNKICKDYSIDFAFENRSDEGENRVVFKVIVNKPY